MPLEILEATMPEGIPRALSVRITAPGRQAIGRSFDPALERGYRVETQGSHLQACPHENPGAERETILTRDPAVPSESNDPPARLDTVADAGAAASAD